MKTLVRHAASWLAEPDDEPPGRADQWNPRAFARLAVSTAFLLVAFRIVNRFVVSACTLPAAALGHESILVECVADRWFVVLPGLVLYGALLVAVPRLRQGWRQFEGGPSLRWFVGTLAVVLAWAGAGYAYNAWYDQPHALDRAALVLLAALIFWRPAFALPFVIAFWAAISQFDFPRLGFQVLVADFRPLANTLTLFASAMLIQALWARRNMSGFLFLALCIVAANFWVPGYAKLRLGWITHGHLYFLLPNAYTHGWLSFLEPRTIESMTAALSLVDWPMRIGTLFIECGALLLFATSRTARAFLPILTLLLGVFFLTLGYFFWKWMILQLALWVLVFRGSDPSAVAWRLDLFTRHRLALSLVVIGGATRWFSPAALAWFDTPLANTIRYEAVGRGGGVYDLSPGFFAPYDSHVAMGTFVGGLTPAPILSTSYGVTPRRADADALLGAHTPADVVRLEDASVGRGVPVDEAFGLEFDEFIRRTATVANRRLAAGASAVDLLALIRPPPFLWTHPRGRPYRQQEPIAFVRVYRVSSFFDGRTYTLFRRELLRTVGIPLPPTGDAHARGVTRLHRKATVERGRM